VKPTPLALVVCFVLMVAITLFGFAAGPWARPAVASQQGENIDTVINYLLVTTGVVFIIGNAGLIWLVLRYSGSGPSGYKPESAKTQWMWALVPVACMAAISEIGVLLLGAPVFDGMYGKAPADSLQVEVVGKQFEWIVRYPGKDGKFGRTSPKLVHTTRNPLGLDEDDSTATDDIVVNNILRVPRGRMVQIRLRTHDVQHSFSVPAFRVKQDLVPGLVTHAQFVPTRTGKFEVVCSQLCGASHYRMRGEVLVMEPQEFDDWLAKQKGWFED
jgi:cytochrome c oxidase subunit 2